jgi:hypothetical protein
LIIEYISLKMYPRVLGHEFRPVPPVSKNRFAPQLLLQVKLNAGTYGRVTHTADGHRLTENINKLPDAGRIFVYGASTAYGSHLKDSETWPSVLSGVLGTNYVVENHGVPGYSTIDNILQVLFDFRNDHAKCAIFYLGGSDLQNANLTGLKPDYSDFHLIRQRNMGTAAKVGFISRRSAFLSLLSELDRGDLVPMGQTRHEYDNRLSRIYRQNIHLIAIITQSFSVKPIFVPEIMELSSDDRQHLHIDSAICHRFRHQGDLLAYERRSRRGGRGNWVVVLGRTVAGRLAKNRFL